MKNFIISLIFFAISCTAYAADDFALLDNKGDFHELYYYSDMKAVVLVSQENDCPIIQKSYSTLEELKKKYEPLGVVFLMINANPQDDRAAINKEAKDYSVDIPILEDRSQVVTEGLGIKRTAEAVLIDPKDWSVVYQGAINDQFGYETQKIAPTQNYLEDAIKAVLANKPVLAPRVSIKGCLFDFQQKSDKPTYIKDIAPILINKCIVCHSPGQIAPWSMNNYEQLKSHGAMIREVVRTKRMPPWGADPYYRKLANDRSLTPEQTRLLVHWVEQGMDRGEGADPLLTAPRPKNDEWPLGKPDLIVSLKNEQSIPTTGLLGLREVPGDKTIDQDRWVRAIYWKPGNSRIVHHAFLYAETHAGEHNGLLNKSGSNSSAMPEGNSHAQFISGLTMVRLQSNEEKEKMFPKDTGIFLPKGTKLLFSIHYMTTGKPEKDETRVGLYFYSHKPKKVLSTLYFDDTALDIPAHAKNFNVKKSFLIKDKITLYTAILHMHLRGRSMKCIAHYPDGSTETIISMPDYRFDWQTKYHFETPLSIPAGTILEFQASYDNSAQNKDNPDPDKEVKWGVYTQDEMMTIMLLCVVELEDVTH